jgi:L-alanine-DL-glutamate epimerase-like enolase superfamily enzyme
MDRRQFLKAALALPAGAWMSHYNLLAHPIRNEIKITDIKSITLKNQWKTLVKVETDAGISGYGESGAVGEVFRGWVHHGNRPIIGKLIGEDPLAIERHYHEMSTQVHNVMASGSVFSGIDMALWDIAGKVLNRPVFELLGGPFREKIRLYHDSQPSDMLDKGNVREWADGIKANPRGWTTIKMSFNHALGYESSYSSVPLPMVMPRQLNDLREAFNNVRQALGEDYDLIAHAHSEFDLPSSIGIAKAVAPSQVLWLEDPLPPTYSTSWKTLKQHSPVPIMNGEKVEMPKGFLPFLENQALDVLHPDLAWCGGITGAKKIADMASLYKVPIALHNLGGYPLLMASIHYAASINDFVMLENAIDKGQGTELMGIDPVVVTDSYIDVPKTPGLMQLDQDYLKANLRPEETWWGDD